LSTIEDLEKRIERLEKKTKHLKVPEDPIMEPKLGDVIGQNEEPKPKEKG
jgi:chaperonin cofactor prefoldin